MSDIREERTPGQGHGHGQDGVFSSEKAAPVSSIHLSHLEGPSTRLLNHHDTR